jgi:ribosomal-protein-alanine N-acetyltransferase
LTYSIRPMVKEDISQVNEIARYIVATDDSRTVAPPPEKPPRGLLRLASRLMPWFKHGDVSRAQLPQQYIAGFSGIWMMADEAHITNLAVRKEYQGRGLGGLLLIATIDLARELKASLLTLEVRVSNLVAQKLYSRYGFTQTGQRRGYYLDNKEDAIIMSTESIASPAFQAQLRQLRESLSRKLPPVSR